MKVKMIHKKILNKNWTIILLMPMLLCDTQNVCRGTFKGFLKEEEKINFINVTETVVLK